LDRETARRVVWNENTKSGSDSTGNGNFHSDFPNPSNPLTSRVFMSVKPTSDETKIRRKPGGPKQEFKCDRCGRLFRDWCNLSQHRATHDKPKFEKACEYCGKEMKSEKSYKSHVGPCGRRGGITWAEQQAIWAAEREKKEANKKPVGRPPKPIMQCICETCGTPVMGGPSDRLSHELICALNEMADSPTGMPSYMGLAPRERYIE